jgi:hypothetical protein
MRIENKRVICRRRNQMIVEDHDNGIFLVDNSFEILKKFQLSDYGVLDYSYNGNILLLNSKKWHEKRNANKTLLTAFNIDTGETLFKTDNFLAYRSIIDSTSTKFLLEYYNGLCLLNLKTGEVLYKKDKVSKSLYNADLHINTNKIFIPTERKSILLFDFNTQNFEEIKLEATSSTTWIKFDNSQNRVLISDKKNSLHCFEMNSLRTPIWTIDFSKHKPDDRIWPSNILTTASNLGCMHGTRPDSSNVGFCTGGLFIFDIDTGKILDKIYDAGLTLKLIDDFNFDEIILDDLSTFSLSKKVISKNNLLASIKAS